MTTRTGIPAWTAANDAAQILFGPTGVKCAKEQKRSGGARGGIGNTGK